MAHGYTPRKSPSGDSVDAEVAELMAMCEEGDERKSIDTHGVTKGPKPKRRSETCKEYGGDEVPTKDKGKNFLSEA